MERLKAGCLSVYRSFCMSVCQSVWKLCSLQSAVCKHHTPPHLSPGQTNKGTPESRLSVYLSVSLSVAVSVSLSVCLLFCLSACLSVCLLSVCLSACLSVSVSVSLSVCLLVCLSVSVSICPSVCQLVCLSVSKLCILRSAVCKRHTPPHLAPAKWSQPVPSFPFFFLPFLAFSFSRAFYFRYLLRRIFFLAAEKSWVLVMGKV